MRVQARWLVGLVLLGAVAVAAVLVNQRLNAMPGRIALDDSPSRTSIVFVLRPGDALRYRLGQARVLRLIANANVAADDLDRLQADGRPVWTVLEVEARDGAGRVLHRQELALHLDPAGQQLDREARSYLDHRLIPSVGKVRALDLGAFEDADLLDIRIAEASPSIVDLSVRLFKVSRVAERELAYLWTRMSDDRRETLARSNLYGQHLMTSAERANQLRHQWFPLPPDNSEGRVQRRLYTRLDDGMESAALAHQGLREPGISTGENAPIPADTQRSFAYVIHPGEPFSHTMQHLEGRATPLRIDLRRLLPQAGGAADDRSLQWRLLAHDGREISSGSMAPSTAPAASERIAPPAAPSSEAIRQYLLISPEVARIDFAARGAPVLLTIAVAHPHRPLAISDDPEAARKTWFLVRASDHEQRFEDGRAAVLWGSPTAAPVDETALSWRRLEPDGLATWRSLTEPAATDDEPGATRQRLALDFDVGELLFTIDPEPETERLLVLRWYAPAGRSESLELEMTLDGRLPVNRAMASWTYLWREVSLAPGGGEFPLHGSVAFAQAPQRVVVRIGPELGMQTLRVGVRSTNAAGHLSASVAKPAAGEWRSLVDVADDPELGIGGGP